MTHSTHFIYSYMVSDCPADLHNVFHCGKVPIAWNSLTRKEGSVLFNDALNTFYLRLNGIRHMVKDHSDSD